MEANIKFVFSAVRSLGNVIPPHSHDVYELVYYLRGRGISTVDGVEYKYGESQYCIIPPMLPHSETAHEETDVLCIGHTCDNPIYAFKTLIADDKDGEILKVAQEIQSEIQSRRMMGKEISDAFLTVMIMKLRRQFGGSVKWSENSSIANAYNYICEYFNTDISLDRLSASVGYSYDRFRHLFAETYGISPKQFIIKKRIETASRKLLLCDDKIGDIAGQCGFKSSAQFTVMFKQKQGMTPFEYRKTHNIRRLEKGERGDKERD